MNAALDLYSEKIALFKRNEKPEAVLLIADRPQLTGILVAWTTTPATRRRAVTAPAGDAEDDIWHWLWENTVFSRGDILAKTGMQEHEFERGWRMLVSNRVIYPDGTLNSFVQRYLREKVLGLFNAKPRAGAKRKQ